MMHFPSWRRDWRRIRIVCALACLAVSPLAHAAEQHGQVTFNGLPVPGATVVAIQGTKKFTTISDQQGNYRFPDLPDGNWTIQVEMSFFATAFQDITLATSTAGTQAPGIRWELKMLPLDQVIAKAKVVKDDTKVAVAGNAATPGHSEASRRCHSGTEAAGGRGEQRWFPCKRQCKQCGNVAVHDGARFRQHAQGFREAYTTAAWR